MDHQREPNLQTQTDMAEKFDKDKFAVPYSAAFKVANKRQNQFNITIVKITFLDSTPEVLFVPPA